MNAPSGHVYSLMSANCYQIVIFVHYRHIMVFNIAILYMPVHCVNSYFIALKNFGYVIHLLENGTVRQKSKRRHAQKISVEGGIFTFSDLILFPPITFEYRCQFGNFLQDT